MFLKKNKNWDWPLQTLCSFPAQPPLMDSTLVASGMCGCATVTAMLVTCVYSVFSLSQLSRSTHPSQAATLAFSVYAQCLRSVVHFDGKSPACCRQFEYKRLVVDGYVTLFLEDYVLVWETMDIEIQIFMEEGAAEIIPNGSSVTSSNSSRAAVTVHWNWFSLTILNYFTTYLLPCEFSPLMWPAYSVTTVADVVILTLFQVYFTSTWRMVGVWCLVSLETAVPEQIEESGINAITQTILWP